MEKKGIKLTNLNLYGIAEIIKGKYIMIGLYKTSEKVGFMELYFRGAKKVTLENIYCMNKYRRQGIGTVLLDISDYLLKDYEGRTLCGVYYPTQMIEAGVSKTEEELDRAARAFYLDRGFNILKHSEFTNNPKMYPEINYNDFSSAKSYDRSIVYRKIEAKDEYRVISTGNIIIENPRYKIKRHAL